MGAQYNYDIYIFMPIFFFTGKGFQEDKDTEWGSDDVLQPVDLNQLNARTFVVYKFGSFVADLVASRCRHAPVTILLAKKIPR